MAFKLSYVIKKYNNIIRFLGAVSFVSTFKNEFVIIIYV